VPLTFVHAGKYRTEDTLKYMQYRNKPQPRKATNTKYRKHNYPGSVASYDTRPGNEVALFSNASEPIRGLQSNAME